MFLIPEITVWIEKQSGGSNYLCFLTRKKKHPLLEGMYQGSSAGPNVGSGQASPVREEGNMLALGKRENAARRGLRTREEKGGDHFYFWSKSSESKSDPSHLHL